MVSVGVIGCGYWGPNLIRNFAKLTSKSCNLTAVADMEPRKLGAIQQLYPKVRLYSAAEDLLAQVDIDAVVIATPVSTHYMLAKAALQHGKHVLIEKPLTSEVSQAEELVQLSAQNRKILMVDHTFIYTGAVRKIRELIETGELGDIYYYDSVRVNLGLFQQDINVLWDLGPHDFAIMSHLLYKKPVSVSAIGARPLCQGAWSLESIVYVTVRFEDGTLAHFHLNWLSPVKVRRTLIGGSRKMIVYDHLDPDNQLKIFDKGIELQTDEERSRMLIQYRLGDMLAPKVDQTEALELVCKHFLECIQYERKPITDGEAGLQVVRLLEAAQKSMENQSEVVKL